MWWGNAQDKGRSSAPEWLASNTIAMKSKPYCLPSSVFLGIPESVLSSAAKQVRQFQASFSLFPGDTRIYDHMSHSKNVEIHILQQEFWASPLCQFILNLTEGIMK